MLIRTPEGRFFGIDGGTMVSTEYRAALRPPASAASRGHGTIAIPGTVAGLAKALAEYGTMTLSDVLAPALTLARDGFPITSGEATRLAAAASELRRNEGAAMHFLKADGSPFRAGERFRQPHLAWTLEQISQQGPDAFYRGEIARRITADMQANGGFLTKDDLAAYQALPSPVVRGRHGEYELIGTWFPASGATLIQILQMMEEASDDLQVDSPEWIAFLARAIRIGFTDRRAELGSAEEKARILTSRDWAMRRAEEIRRSLMAGVSLPEGDWYPAGEPENTTHLSVADRHGGLVALTQSIGPSFGSHVATPGLGFLYASTQGYLGSRPGSRPASSQAPFLMIKNGQPVYVMGGSGAGRIISSLSLVMSRLFAVDIPLEQAMAAPRFHPLTRDRIVLEAREGAVWPAGTAEALASLGFEVSTHGYGSYFGRIHAIAFDPATGEWLGVADLRRDGAAAAPPD